MSQFLSSLWARWRHRPTRVHPAARAAYRPRVECLETRALPSITLPTNGTFGPATVMGTSSADQFVLQLQAGNNGMLQISDNGGTTFSSVSLYALSAVNVYGYAGDDTLTLNNANGLVGYAGGLTINFDGGTGRNQIVMTGNPNTIVAENYQVGDTADAGYLSANSATGGSFTFNFQNTASIIDTLNATDFTVAFNNNNNYVTVGTGLAQGSLTTMKLSGIDYQNNNIMTDDVFVDASGVPAGTPAAASFVPITFANKSNVLIDGQGGADQFVLDDNSAVSGLSTLAINGNTGTDRVTGDMVPPGVSFATTNIYQTLTGVTDRIFIQQLYVQRLQRVANDTEVADWLPVLHSDGIAAVVQGIDQSVEAETRMVSEWYQLYLGRPADADGLGGFVNGLQAGVGEESALAGLLSSPEFIALQGQTYATGSANDRFIRGLYVDLLGRTPNSTEVTNWEKVMQVYSPYQAALAFVTGAEVRQRAFTADYDAYLNRNPDATTMKTLLAANYSLEQVREGILGSMEFFDPRKHAATPVTFNVSLQAQSTGASVNTSDQQIYSFIVGKTHVLNLVSSSSNGLNATVQLEDATGTVLASTNPASSVLSFRTTVQPGQTYYLRVASSDVTPSDYTINLALV